MYYQTFSLVANNLAPLFIYIMMGFVGGRVLNIDRLSIANFLFFLVNPVVFFYNISTADVTSSLIAIPVIFYILSCSICLLFYFLGKKVWHDDTANLLALASGTGNVGYFMLPIVITFFSSEYYPMFFLMIIGVSFYENTLGFYISAAGTHTKIESLKKLLKLPTLYAFILALIFSYFKLELPEPLFVFSKNISRLYSILGMMVIGLSIATIRNYRIDLKFVGMAFLARYVVWPIGSALLVFLDDYIFHIYDKNAHKLWMIAAFIPMGVNVMIVAMILKNKPEKVATAVLFSTITAMFYIPLVLVIFN